MDVPPAVSPSTPTSFAARHKILLIIGGIFIVIVYIGVNISIWRYAQNSKKSAQTVVEQNGAGAGEGLTAIKPTEPPPTIGPSPTPTPRPTGPGQYACSPMGTCKNYSDEVRREKCTVTYADRLCLDQCRDTSKQCKN